MRATRPTSTDVMGYIETNKAPKVAEKTHRDPDRKPRTVAAQSSSESMRTPGLMVLLRAFGREQQPDKTVSLSNKGGYCSVESSV
jgi:hypothetical protein